MPCRERLGDIQEHIGAVHRGLTQVDLRIHRMWAQLKVLISKQSNHKQTQMQKQATNTTPPTNTNTKANKQFATKQPARMYNPPQTAEDTRLSDRMVDEVKTKTQNNK